MLFYPSSPQRCNVIYSVTCFTPSVIPFTVSDMKTYDLAQYSYSWNDPEVITISSYDNQLIGTFPLSFIKRGGLNIWAFVSDIVHQLVGTAGGGVIMANDGNPVILQEAPYAGHFVFVPHSE